MRRPEVARGALLVLCIYCLFIGFTAVAAPHVFYDDFPFQLGANYPNYSGYNQTGSLADIKGAGLLDVSAKNLLPYLQKNVPAGNVWFSFSEPQEHAAVVAGYFTQSQLTAIEKVVASVSTLRYDKDGSRIYEVKKP